MQDAYIFHEKNELMFIIELEMIAKWLGSLMGEKIL